MAVGGALLMTCAPPLLLVESWLLGRIAIAVGIVLRRRLLLGAVKLPLDAARQSGYGDFVCQIIESEAVELGLRSGACGRRPSSIFWARFRSCFHLAGDGADLARRDFSDRALCLWHVSRPAALDRVALSPRRRSPRKRCWAIARAWCRSRAVCAIAEKTMRCRISRPRTLARCLVGDAVWVLAECVLVAGFCRADPRVAARRSSNGRMAAAFGDHAGLSRTIASSWGLSQLAAVVIALRRCQHLLKSAAAPNRSHSPSPRRRSPLGMSC